MWMRYAAFAAPVLLVAALAVAIVLTVGAGPHAAAAATVARQAGGDLAEAPPPEPQATPVGRCKNGTVVASPADNPGLVADCALLLAAKDTLRGTETLNWSASVAIGSWEGITTGGTPSRVTRLEIDGWNSERRIGRRITLSGTIPAGLGGLAKLERLVLSRNALTGTIPAELGNLTELTALLLYSNQLTGSIPAELGRLPNLRQLELNHNQLSGAIPVELGQLPNLRALQLQSNQLTGAIPAALGELTELTHLNLSGNTFTGCIPASLRDVRLNDLGSLSISYCTTTTTYTLTTAAGEGGRISPLPGTHTYLSGASVTVTATPDAGWRLASWSGDCSGTTASCALTLDANKTASVSFERIPHMLTVTVSGEGGSVEPSGTTTQYEGDDVTLTASWNDATHGFTGWGGDCSGTASSCVLTIDAAKTVTATFAALPADRCATTTAADCIRAVYRGAPTDYAQVADIPAGALLTADSDGRYRVERGQQYTVVTAAALPTGWTRFWLEYSPLEFGTPRPVSFSQLIAPVGTTYTFTVATDEAAATLITFDLKQARPFVRPRPDGKPHIGATVVTTVFSVVSCESGFATANPGANAELVADCETLLALRDTLAGDAALNWSAGTAMTSWTSVTVGGTPQRVTGLSLPKSGLTGELSGLLGNLTGLTELRLNGNALTGMVPSKLSQLTNLTHVYLAGNAFTGCAPPELRAVTNNDIAASGLADCGTPSEIGAGEHTLSGGTYTYTARIPSLPQVIFDVPAGVQLEVSHLSIGIPTAEHPRSAIGLHLQDASGTSRLCIEVQEAFECGRLVATSDAGGANPGTAFDRIVESAWSSAPLPADAPLKPFLARNVIVEDPIEVCSPAPSVGPPPAMLASNVVVYPNTLAGAVAMWNSALRTVEEPAGPHLRHNVFKLVSPCPAEPEGGPSSDKLDYVEVYGEIPVQGSFDCGGPEGGGFFAGCFILGPLSNNPYFTFTQTARILLNADYFPVSADTQPMVDDLFAVSRYEELVTAMNHELGHVLGIGHIVYTTSTQCTISDGAEECVIKEFCTPGAIMGCGSQEKEYLSLSADDYAHYKAIYDPNRVTHITGLSRPFAAHVQGTSGTFRIAFSARNTIAEKNIEIRRKLGAGLGGWSTPLRTYGADTTDVTVDLPVEDPPAADDSITFGIFVTTNAYLAGQAQRTTLVGLHTIHTPIGFPRMATVVVGQDPPFKLPSPPEPGVLVAPTITELTAPAGGQQVRASFEWSGMSDHFLQWQLSRAPGGDPNDPPDDTDFDPVTTPRVQTADSVTFGPVPLGWYKLHGRACQYSYSIHELFDQALSCGQPGNSRQVLLKNAPPPPIILPPGPTRTLTRIVSPAGSGRISANPRSPFYHGDVVTLTAIPAFSFYYFTGWGGDCDGAGRGSCVITMDADKSVTATFSYDCEPITGCSRSINAEEQRAGFTFKVNSGEDTASGARARTATPLAVTVTIGGSDPLDVSPVQGEAGTWLVQVPANASFLTEGSHDVLVEWRRGKELVASSTTTILVDLTAPSVSYTAPTSLTVGAAVSIAPSTTDTDIASYALKTGSSLPSGLALDGTSGVVSGTPTAAMTAGDVTIVVTDDAGNTRHVTLALPEVDE